MRDIGSILIWFTGLNLGLSVFAVLGKQLGIFGTEMMIIEHSFWICFWSLICWRFK